MKSTNPVVAPSASRSPRECGWPFGWRPDGPAGRTPRIRLPHGPSVETPGYSRSSLRDGDASCKSSPVHPLRAECCKNLRCGPEAVSTSHPAPSHLDKFEALSRSLIRLHHFVGGKTSPYCRLHSLASSVLSLEDRPYAFRRTDFFFKTTCRGVVLCYICVMSFRDATRP